MQTPNTTCQKSAVQEAVQRRWAAQAASGEHAVPQVQPAGQHIIPARGACSLDEAQQTTLACECCVKANFAGQHASSQHSPHASHAPCWAPLPRVLSLRSNIAAENVACKSAALHLLHMQGDPAASAPPNAVDAQPAVPRLPLDRRAPPRLVGLVVPSHAKHLFCTVARARLMSSSLY